MSHIDVIVVCYNYGRFLRKCVESVLAQSHRDLRVLIADDASTDDTPVICQELVSKDPRVEVLRHATNQGHIRTYNECIDLSGDDYMLLLSADDYLLPGSLARAIAVLDTQPDVGLVHGAWLLGKKDGTISDRGAPACKTKVLDGAWLIERLAWNNYVGTATAIVRTSVQKKLGGYRLELPHAGDLEMWLRFALYSKVAYVAEPQAVHRRHDSNMSQSYGERADLQQCVESFRLHYRDIRRCVPDGMRLEARIRRLFATKTLNVAVHLGQQGQMRTSLILRLLAIWERLYSRMLRLRARFAMHPYPRS